MRNEKRRKKKEKWETTLDVTCPTFWGGLINNF
jgi:hypothetical protein